MQELFTLTKCKTDLSCKAKLNKRQKLDFSKIKKRFKVVTDAGIALVLKVESIEVVVHGYGEIVFKLGKKKVSEKKPKSLIELTNSLLLAFSNFVT